MSDAAAGASDRNPMGLPSLGKLGAWLKRGDLALAIGVAEHVRARLARQICAQYTSPSRYVPLIALTVKWEQNFAESILGQGEEKTLAMQPSRLSEFIALVRDRFEEAARGRAKRRCW